MGIEIRNNDTISHTWGGKLYASGEVYSLTSHKEHYDLYGDSNFYLSLIDKSLSVIHSGHEVLDVSTAINLVGLLPQINPTDVSDRQIVRMATTNDGWIYSPRSLDFYTSKYNSLYNREHDGNGIDDGTDMGDATMHFFDTNGDVLTKGQNESPEDFQIRLTAGCVKTYVDFEAQFDIDIYGCKLMIANTPSSRAYLWAIVAPDVPKAFGGSIPFMGGGMNLLMIEPKIIGYTDGKSPKIIKYDPVYHSGKIRLVIKHGVGDQIGIQMIYEFYKGVS